MRVIIFPYSIKSNSSKSLAGAFNTRRVFPDRQYKPRRGDLIVNWGNANAPTWSDILNNSRVLNPWNVVVDASHKLRSLRIMRDAGVSIPDFTEDKEEVAAWLKEDKTVVVRDLMRASGGRGISLIGYNDSSQIPDAPLYVKYIKKLTEFRVHIFDDEVIDVQQKKTRNDQEGLEVDYQIRNHDRGWIFAREDITYDESVIDESLKAMRSLGLDFGAVDVIWNEYQKKAYVLEVNTAPGIEGTTLDNYINAINKVVGE